MKIQSLPLLFAAATLANAADEQARNLASLAEKWNLAEPTFAYSANTFSLEFPVTDFINSGMVDYSLWTSPDCQEGNDNIMSNPAWATQYLEENAALQAATQFGPGGTQLDSGAFNNRAATVYASFDPETIGSASFYSESTNEAGQLSARVEFCIRFGLWTRSDQGITGSELEVNFLETIITLNVDLTDGFNIDGIDVTPKDKLERTANVAYGVRGYECNDDTSAVVATGLPRNQGEVITVCVTPEDEAIADGIFMRSIDNFAWDRDGTITQQAILANAPAGNLLTDYSPASCRGVLICQFSSILIADFFFSTGSVAGAGVASLQFGQEGALAQRKLRAGRALQEAPGGEPSAAEFDLDVSVAQAVPRSRSGAASTFVGAVLGFAMAVAAMMI